MGGQTISVAISRVVIVYKPIESIWGDSSNKPQSIQLYYKFDRFACKYLSKINYTYLTPSCLLPLAFCLSLLGN
ncbi:MAG: hypothetical protein EWV92_14430 [Microcystis aeruginosa Ma_MB_S_20031200_S102]|uniref:Uncharacterized protein n=1 Tax=Microcystis aeruginosa Ma_MB_S_20031200_S102 TaxID=2486254 RepID=A0A552EKF5_MICAE|nr:MAG: hypothetical protein EWV79_03385 [Microcystis aeruginosa Ma_MB_S_20031200_S102D]TRU34939.1 MAG: hypothetical protein EWV92_14430 [Microcystis aeruginosa Ma_MB_S_20031200_S102]